MRQSSTKPLPLIPIDGNLLSRSREDCPIGVSLVVEQDPEGHFWRIDFRLASKCWWEMAHQFTPLKKSSRIEWAWKGPFMFAQHFLLRISIPPLRGREVQCGPHKWSTDIWSFRLYGHFLVGFNLHQLYWAIYIFLYNPVIWSAYMSGCDRRERMVHITGYNRSDFPHREGIKSMCSASNTFLVFLLFLGPIGQ